MKYGKILKSLRKDKGVTQQEIACELNVDRSTYAKYETAKSQPNFDTLVKIADYFDVSTDYLLCRNHQYIKNKKD